VRGAESNQSATYQHDAHPYTHIHTHTHAHIYIYIYMYTNTHTFTTQNTLYTYVQTNKQTHTQIHTHVDKPFDRVAEVVIDESGDRGDTTVAVEETDVCITQFVSQ
jgi:hypothetical protein